MSLRSKLNIEDVGMFAALAFYAIAGIVCLAVLPFANFPPHVGMIGALSLITAYGLFKKRVWTVWLVAVMFLVATAFSGYTLYYVIWKELFLGIIMIVYLVLTWVFTAYTVAKRKTLTS